MAEFAGDIIKSALQEILVQASEAELEPDETQDALTYMNRFMDQIAAQGTALGYTQVTSPSDPITIPEGAINGLVFELAIRLAPQFGKAVSIDLRQNAKDGRDAMRRIAVFVRSSVFPDTLPRGSGNEDDFNGSTGRHFYPGNAGQILTEQNGPILLEDET